MGSTSTLTQKEKILVNTSKTDGYKFLRVFFKSLTCTLLRSVKTKQQQKTLKFKQNLNLTTAWQTK